VPNKLDAAQDQWGAIQMAEPLYQIEFAAHDGAGHAGLDRGAHDRRGTSRTNSGDPKAVFDCLKQPIFPVAAFKGQRLTLRDWNLQLRQPSCWSTDAWSYRFRRRKGFLHQSSELDTLGVDRRNKSKLH